MLPGAAELAARGVASTLAAENRAAVDVADHPALALLIDPQTSGGLLASLPSERAPDCLVALRAIGLDAAIIGRVGAGPAGLRLD
jgi:selenide, water dikinase